MMVFVTMSGTYFDRKQSGLMPNEILITQLDTLRETYSQQQKTNANLQNALKSVTVGQNKAQKALRDYRANVDVNNAIEAFNRSRLKEETVDPLLPDLKRELKTLLGTVNALKEAATALRSEPVDVVQLDKALSVLQSASAQDIQDLLPELMQELDLAQRNLGDEFGQKLRDELAKQGIQIGGRAPKFEIGRFELEANFAKRFITVRYGKDVVIPRAPITAEAAVKAYQNALKTVTGRNTDGKAWMAQFHEAYQTAKRRRGIDGTRVNIVDCYIEMVLLRQGRAFISEPSKRTFTDYSRAQFIYDFYEFTNPQHLDPQGQSVKAHSATKSQTDSPAKSMWIVEGDSPYDGRYISDIEFVKE
jgi:hypothetical protein